MDKNDMELHKIIFKAVQEIINDYDPVGLIEGGAPDDEYHDEVGKIVVLLRKESEREPLAERIEEVFREAFGNEVKSDQSCPICRTLI
jgi:hypothetical protein